MNTNTLLQRIKLKIAFLLILIFLFSMIATVKAQVLISTGNGDKEPQESALLELQSKNLGVLFPRLNLGERDELIGFKSIPDGLFLYGSDSHQLMIFDSQQNNFISANPWKSDPSINNIWNVNSGNIGIGISSPSEKLHVNGNILSTGNITSEGDITAARLSVSVPNGDGLMPAGGIIMWSGNPNNIPSGWALCDGANGTPDLRGRFIVGYDPNDTDYNTTDFVGSAMTGGNKTMEHTHSINHNHPSFNSGGSNSTVVRLNEAQVGPKRIVENNHTHPINPPNYVGTSGGASNTENRPPYYTLAYIIKL